MWPESVLLVRHASGHVAIDLRLVREVVRMLAPRVVPGVPKGILGVMNLRGEMIPLVDLEARLPAGGGPPGAGHHIVVLDADGRAIGLAVTDVEGIAVVREADFRAAGDILPAGVPVIGLARLESRVVAVLDVAGLLTATEAMKLEEVMRRISGAGGLTP